MNEKRGKYKPKEENVRKLFEFLRKIESKEQNNTEKTKQ